MWERDKMFSKYHKCKNPLNKSNLFSQYQLIRNEVTKLKKDNKIKYYKEFFEINNKKTSAIWKGIRSLVTIKPSNLHQLTIIDKMALWRQTLSKFPIPLTNILLMLAIQLRWYTGEKTKISIF